MSIATIPCIKLKCLMVPVCKYKKHIECPHISRYYIELKLKNKHTVYEAWNVINSFLDNMKTMQTGLIDNPEYSYLEEVLRGDHGHEEYNRIFGD
jgi:hypothetical protein